ncbi:MAG: hypothetical protein EPN75_02280 [Beijerinckiaceae bacterium]|nr:MAG: hypothetical protein EPN75_02280 [Beijerinckiaceae bacterium]
MVAAHRTKWRGYGLFRKSAASRRACATAHKARAYAWSLWRRAHQAAAKHAHYKSKMQLFAGPCGQRVSRAWLRRGRRSGDRIPWSCRSA